jgi:hypothetical protein
MVGAVVAIGLSCASGSKLTADQRRGKQIYEGLCDKCHKLIAPKNLADEAWSQAVDKYGVPLKLRPDELALLKAYLTRANDSDF